MIYSTNNRPAHDIKPSTLLSKRGGEEIKPGTLHGGEEIKPGTLHGGEEIKPGTLHGGEEIKPGTLHGGEEIKPGTLHGGEEIKPGTLHGGEEIKPGTLHGGEEIKPGTLHSGEVIIGGTLCASYSPATYRTKDGTAFYKFNYVQTGNHFEIDILNQPSYEGRDSGMHKAHWLSSSRGGKKICISRGQEPKTIAAAKNISMQWAELTHNYIKTGKSIDQQVREQARSSSNDSQGGLWNWLFG